MREVKPSLNQIKEGLKVTNGSGWNRVASLAPAQEYPPGIELFRQEAPPQDVYLIEGGLVKLMYAEMNAREIIVGLRSSGWVVGAASVIIDRRYAFSATTLTRCQLRRVSAEAFMHLLGADPEFLWYLQQVQSHELYDQLTQLVSIGCLSARDKLQQLLSQLIPVLVPASDEKNVRLKLPLKHREVAELIGVTPEHLSRVLKEMQDEGVVFREKGWITITDVRLLRGPAEKLRAGQ